MRRILIIDDDRQNSEMLRDMISNMGHEVTRAFTAKEGLRAGLFGNMHLLPKNLLPSLSKNRHHKIRFSHKACL